MALYNFKIDPDTACGVLNKQVGLFSVAVDNHGSQPYLVVLLSSLVKGKAATHFSMCWLMRVKDIGEREHSASNEENAHGSS